MSIQLRLRLPAATRIDKNNAISSAPRSIRAPSSAKISPVQARDWTRLRDRTHTHTFILAGGERQVSWKPNPPSFNPTRMIRIDTIRTSTLRASFHKMERRSPNCTYTYLVTHDQADLRLAGRLVVVALRVRKTKSNKTHPHPRDEVL